MNINRYITRGISEQLSLDLQILLWHMVEEKDNQPEKNQNALPKKVYVIREDDVDVFYYVMLLPEEY